MVHALAPKAKIILVKAASDSATDVHQAEKVAANAVAAAGGGEISNSWGSLEFAAETTPFYRTPFTKAKVVFFASTGDVETPSYPAVLPNVVAVGGTSVLRDSAGNFLSDPLELDLPRFRGGVKAWVQGIWSDGILSSCLRLFFCSALAEFVFPSRPARL